MMKPEMAFRPHIPENRSSWRYRTPSPAKNGMERLILKNDAFEDYGPTAL